MWQMFISSFINDPISLPITTLQLHVNDRKLILENDDIFSRFFSSSLLKHRSQELDSNTAKLLLENQLKYSSSSYSFCLSLSFSTWTIVRLRFHSPSDRQQRKEVERRPFNWNRRSNPQRAKKKKKTNQDTDQKTWADLISIAQQSHAPKTNITTKENMKTAFAFDQETIVLVCRSSLFDLKKQNFISQMDKVLLSIIKPKERKKDILLSIIEWHRSRLRLSLHYIEPSHLLEGNCLSLSLNGGSNGWYLSHRIPMFIQAQSNIHKKLSRCCLPPIRLSEHTLQFFCC